MSTVDDALDGARMAEAGHRLKTMLAVLTGWAITLDERWDQLSDERRREAAGVIRRASEELAVQAAGMLEDDRAELHPAVRIGTKDPGVIALSTPTMDPCPTSGTGTTSRS